MPDDRTRARTSHAFDCGASGNAAVHAPTLARSRLRRRAVGYGRILRAAFDKLKAALPQVEGDFVTEGDLVADRPGAPSGTSRPRGAIGSCAQPARRQRSLRTELVAALRPNGTQDLWAADRRTLTYAIDRSSFKDPKQAALVETHIKAAVADWVAACTAAQKCGLQFVFRNDAKPSHNDNTFIVKLVNAKGAFIAAAFFPSYPSARRFVHVDPSFFTTTYDKTGVLRHELGHVLGYRHEHIRDILGCKLEGTQWLPITPYDPHSVMHYLCGGGGTLSLQLTDVDKMGHVKAYGGQ